MAELLELNSEHSTTRLVTREVPTTEEPPDAVFKTVLFLPEGEGRQGEGGLRTQGYFKRSLPDKPLITVITVVFNGAQHLEETILSVVGQTYDNVEYIVIDGGSTDGTLDIIRKYEHAIDYWVSEKDEGIYCAMNKGIMATTGIAVFFAGAGDIIFGNIKMLNIKMKDNKMIIAPVLIDNKKIIYPDISKMPPIVHHQAVFFFISHLKKIGIYLEKYRIHADFDLITRCFLHFGFVEKRNVICSFKKGGVSTNGKNCILSIRELYSIYYKYNKNIFSFRFVMLLSRPVYYFVKSCLMF